MAKEPEKKTSAQPNEITNISMIGKGIAALLIAWLANSSPYALIFFIVSMLPSIVAILLDKGEGKFASKTITVCNFIGVLPYLFNIAYPIEPAVMGAIAKQLIYNIKTWILIYGFALTGWAIVWLLPNITQVIFVIRTELKHNRLEDKQQELIDEWGKEVSLGKTKYQLQKESSISLANAQENSSSQK